MHARAHLHARPDIFHYVCSIFCLQGVHIYFVHVFFTMYRFLSVSMHCSIFAQVASFTLLFQISSQELERNGFLEANRPEVDVEVDLTRPSCSGAFIFQVQSVLGFAFGRRGRDLRFADPCPSWRSLGQPDCGCTGVQ